MAWLGEVPVHWEARRLKYVASCNNDVINEDNGPDRLIRYVDIGNVSEGRIQEAEEFSFHNAPSRARRLVKDGDIIISTVRTYLRAIAVIHNPPEEMVVSTGFAAIRPQEIDGNFLAQALKSNAFVDWVVAESKGISYPAINASELMGLSVALPPTEEQSTIATFLDKETTQIDQLIEKKTRFIELLKEKRAALITEAVTGKFDVRTGKPYAEYKDSGVEWLGKVPAHWDVKRIKFLVRCLDGQRVPLNSEQRADIKGHIPYWGSGGIVDYINKYLFDEELILLGEDGAPFFDRYRPVAYLVSGKVWINNHIHVLRNISHVPSEWVVHALNCVEYRSYIDGSTRDKLTQDDMKEIAIVFPSSLHDIEFILDFVGQHTYKIDQLIEKTKQSINLLKEKRAALITAAVTGKIDVRDFNPKR